MCSLEGNLAAIWAGEICTAGPDSEMSSILVRARPQYTGRKRRIDAAAICFVWELEPEGNSREEAHNNAPQCEARTNRVGAQTIYLALLASGTCNAQHAIRGKRQYTAELVKLGPRGGR